MRRSAYTLVEILVVVAILAILTALIVGAVMRTTGSAQVKATTTEINALKRVLTQQWNFVADDARNGPKGPTATSVHDWVKNTFAGSDQDSERRLKVIYTKLRLKQAFPQSLAEVLRPSGYAASLDLPPYQPYVAALNEMGFTSANVSTTPQPWESAVCLYLALTIGPNGGGSGGELDKYSAIVDGNKARGFVDSWGQPLAFCRWPTASAELNPSGPTNGTNDTGDPNGYLCENAWLSSATYTGNFQKSLHAIATRGPGSTAGTTVPRSYKLQPLIVSGGPDRKLGLNTSLGTTSAADIADNIYSSRLP
jgi:prepilin-type N-terminal cleavage/methylation domain-containing protein